MVMDREATHGMPNVAYEKGYIRATNFALAVMVFWKESFKGISDKSRWSGRMFRGRTGLHEHSLSSSLNQGQDDDNSCYGRRNHMGRGGIRRNRGERRWMM
jgi:hypothetical protein